ncbi:MAG: hypothetical protein JXR48_15950 [Candidatus Delongbacteria bacterium]|nr:hypothetical protein [Candidatus Delongbacteria bacterium]MBN2836451.1 hypothetical protein [Candidatus Delongbacteria bacterium]
MRIQSGISKSIMISRLDLTGEISEILERIKSENESRLSEEKIKELKRKQLRQIKNSDNVFFETIQTRISSSIRQLDSLMGKIYN